VLAVAFHLLVVGYEEPRLRARFGGSYETYRRTVPALDPTTAGTYLALERA
jgi:protein-S-isoprenylcysteine O-methyltransferase Ste14